MHSPVSTRHAQLLNFVDRLLGTYIDRHRLGQLVREVVTVPITQVAEFRALGRHAMEECIVMGEEVLPGQFLLEQTDLFVDSKNKRLNGNPDHPDGRVLKVRRAG